ncbi:MAG: hypothetical protein CL916_06250 [Deltaproteobacteria bacterium]|nr:hypothetical protein [Deltaproteobacteria bacterium]
MEVYLLCIAIDGANDRVAWSTFIVEPEGFVEEKSGLASSHERAILWAIKEGLCGVPSTAHVAIKSTSNAALRLGESTISLDIDEALSMENADLISSIIERAQGQTLAWNRPSFLEAGDSRAIKIAQEIIQDPMSCYPPEEVDFIMQSYERQEAILEDSSTNEESVTEETKDVSENEESTKIIEDTLQNDSMDLDIQVQESEKKSPIEDIPESTYDDSTYPITKTYKPILKSKLPPPAKKTQLHVEGPDYLFGARILAYVDGIGSGNLGAWSFVLVDRKTGFALARASGMRASTPYRARLIACIEVLSALKAVNQEIEIRSRWQKLVKLGDQWMYKWKAKNWKKSGNESIQEVGYIQQLDALCSQHRMSWLYIPDHNDEHGIQFCKHLVKNALNDINSGHKHVHSERLKDFPIDKLL